MKYTKNMKQRKTSKIILEKIEKINFLESIENFKNNFDPIKFEKAAREAKKTFKDEDLQKQCLSF
ncbi:hypothetical protein COS54_01565 [Candidatus Shapirobacteria bacterium CG03_land_8_20_14_0_80_39_12]|uniref:Uncharacterized protein n=1 Tax=Candidatus Shapirobacteria bacterium CG03_land_8_20_14_0_80_39_12 TaxID=1974879 RepID=A0A2M7BDI3_9BACT|nr:MAG: hypothetical protein COS54_01565 [Candidatus Shapirobacteria bacterium CG03_land_8_20_14_0_80_39_12]